MKSKAFLGDVEPLEIQLADGTILNCIMNVDAFILLKDEFEDVTKIIDEYSDKPYELAAVYLYCGVKPGKPSFALDEARALICKGGIVLACEVQEVAMQNLFSMGGDESKKVFLKELDRMQAMLMK